jgi:hypothetical protein
MNGYIPFIFNNIGYIFLCEVALGNMKRYSNAHHSANLYLSGFNSVYGEGTHKCTQMGLFDIFFLITLKLNFRSRLERDVVIYPGPIKYFKKKTLEYNEYIVYDTNQIRLR